MRWLRWKPLGPSVMPSCVVDASVLARVVADEGHEGDRARALLRPYRLAAPDYCVVEVLSVIRGRVLGGRLASAAAGTAMSDFAELRIDRFDAAALAARIWELRDNLTTYDAGYVALAEALGCPLITADARIARAPGVRCVVDVV
jgi:predicted nucleic acid-binding protein